MEIYIISVIAIALILSIKFPELVFWIGVFGTFDIGRYFEYYSNQVLDLDVFQYLFLLFIFFPLISPKIKISEIRKNRDLHHLTKFLILFCFYHLFVYGLFVSNNINDFFYFTAKFSPEIVGCFSLVPAYLFIKKKPYRFYHIFVWLSVIYIGAYFLTILSVYDLMPTIGQAIRVSTERRILPHFAYIQFIVSLAFILIISKFKVSHKKLYLLLGLGMILVVLMSMSRLRILIMVIQIIIMAVISSKVYKFKISIYLRTLLGATLLFIIVINIIPKYYDATTKMYQNIYSEFFTEEVKAGTYQSRTEYEIPMQLSLLNKNPFWGTGYNEKWYSGGRGVYNASDTPFIAAIAMFGIIGISFYLIFYFKVFLILKKYLKFLRFNYITLIKNEQTIPIILWTLSLGILFTVLINVGDYFKELIRGERAVYIGVFLGMLLALKDRTEIDHKKNSL